MESPINITSLPIKIYSRAPIRICDIGGWTDTWFAQYGEIFNIAVSPFAEVQVIAKLNHNQTQRFIIEAKNYGIKYAFDKTNNPRKFPLLEATILAQAQKIPDEISLEITIYSQAPVGSSTGTSAAVTVALIAALDKITPGELTRAEIAKEAHRIETEILGLESGIQDQICSAYGGINYISIPKYPTANVHPLKLSTSLTKELEDRLQLIYLGKSHSSSKIHQMVITQLKNAGPSYRPLEMLRQAARDAKQAICNGNFTELGNAMKVNTQAQKLLHPSLISADASRIFQIAQKYGSLGWKVNGAGGEGGSVTILWGSEPESHQLLIHEMMKVSSAFQNIPIRLDNQGITVQHEFLG